MSENERPTQAQLKQMSNSFLLYNLILDTAHGYWYRLECKDRITRGTLHLQGYDQFKPSPLQQQPQSSQPLLLQTNEAMLSKDKTLRDECEEMERSGYDFSHSNDPRMFQEFISETGGVRDKRYNELTERQQNTWKLARFLYRTHCPDHFRRQA